MKISTTRSQQRQGRAALRWGAASVLTAAVLLLIATSGSAALGPATGRVLGWRTQPAQGEVTSSADFQETGEPSTLGVTISADTLATLPEEPPDYYYCYAPDGNGVTAQATECILTHEVAVPLPDAVTQWPLGSSAG